MFKATAIGKVTEVGHRLPVGRAVLDHEQRHLRRCRLELEDGQKLLVDLPETVALGSDDVLILEGGDHIEIVAAHESLYEVTGRDAIHLAQLAWHVGNRHHPAEIAEERMLIPKDHVIKSMLEGLGGRVREILAPFSPVRGAYSGHGPYTHANGDFQPGKQSPEYRLLEGSKHGQN